MFGKKQTNRSDELNYRAHRFVAGLNPARSKVGLPEVSPLQVSALEVGPCTWARV
jgi:hypothetical protein